MTFLKPFEPQLYAVLRIVVGFLLLFHGLQKLINWPEMQGFEEMPSWIRFIAGPVEFGGGLLVMLGLLTRPAAFLASGQMAAAYFIGHQGRGLLPIQNGGDLAVIYCFVFLYVAARGAGSWGVDRS